MIGAARAGRMLAVYAGGELVYQLTGANLSSPQTAEMNAKKRAPTIAKWVMMTHGKSAVWIALLCALDGTAWPLLGGGLAAVDMHFSYRYAIKSGLASSAPGTEHW